MILRINLNKYVMLKGEYVFPNLPVLPNLNFPNLNENIFSVTLKPEFLKLPSDKQ